MSQPDLDHLLPTARAIAVRLDAERIDWVRAERWIDYPVALECLAELQAIIEQPPRGRMRNVLIFGPSGVGKSMLLARLLENNAGGVDRVGSATAHPVLYVLMPPTPKPLDFFVQVFRSLGAPVPTTHTVSKLQTNAVRLLRECHTRTLVIDEINSVLAGSPLQQRAFLQLLRFLSNELRLGLICAGTPEAAHALTGEPQLRSRFVDFKLPRWQNDEALRAFLARLVQSLPLRKPSPVDSPSLRNLIVERSAGLTTTICHVYERAAIAAIRSGREMLDRSSFEDAAVWRGVTQAAKGGTGAAI
jgi:replication-associated recombination protein RarA